MTMKHFNLLLIALTMSASGVFAQSQATKRADKHFSRLEFVKAAADYESLVSKGNADAYVYSRLADCYYNVFNTVAAESYYAKALETSDDPELKYKYAQMLKANGKYRKHTSTDAINEEKYPAQHSSSSIGSSCFSLTARFKILRPRI